MKLTIKSALSTLAIMLSSVTSASSQTGDSVPSADDVVAKMLRGDVERKSELTGYTALRRYVAVNNDRRAEMVARLDCSPDGTKQFTVISEEGSSAIRKHVCGPGVESVLPDHVEFVVCWCDAAAAADLAM